MASAVTNRCFKERINLIFDNSFPKFIPTAPLLTLLLRMRSANLQCSRPQNKSLSQSTHTMSRQSSLGTLDEWLAHWPQPKPSPSRSVTNSFLQSRLVDLRVWWQCPAEM